MASIRSRAPTTVESYSMAQVFSTRLTATIATPLREASPASTA